MIKELHKNVTYLQTQIVMLDFDLSYIKSNI